MSLPSRRSLAEARIALGSFDRFLLLYGTMFAAFGVASPFLPALLHERGLRPSEIGAVLAAGTAVRLMTGPIISRLADRLGQHRRIFLAVAAVIAFSCGLPTGFAIFLIVSVAHASTLAPPTLAATAQGIYGGIAVGTMTAIMTLVSGPLYGALGPRAFWVMALLCAAALPIAFAMRKISINASGSKPIA